MSRVGIFLGFSLDGGSSKVLKGVGDFLKVGWVLVSQM